MFKKVKAFLKKIVALFVRLGDWKWCVMMVATSVLLVLSVHHKIYGVLAAATLALLAWQKLKKMKL